MSKYLNSAGKMTMAGQHLAADLYNEAVGSMIKWLSDGDADRHCRYGNLPRRVLAAAQVDRDLREDIAIETFVIALVPFLRNLDAGLYDATRGASIPTYFIGACRNRLGDVIRAHQQQVEELRGDTVTYLALLQRPDAGFEEFEGRELARKLLLQAPHDLRAALLLRIYEGVSLAEAAKRLGLNPTTVRSHLLRFKKKLIKKHFTGGIVIPQDTVLGQWVANETTAISAPGFVCEVQTAIRVTPAISSTAPRP